jgi:hypothetical protein
MGGRVNHENNQQGAGGNQGEFVLLIYTEEVARDSVVG